MISSELIQRKDPEPNINSYLYRFEQIDSCRPFDEEMRVELPRVLDRIMERIQVSPKEIPQRTSALLPILHAVYPSPPF